jgi:hypothetical protein
VYIIELLPPPTPVGLIAPASSKLSQISPAAEPSIADTAELPPSPENFNVPRPSELIVTE